jgi:hypothetical protein
MLVRHFVGTDGDGYSSGGLGTDSPGGRTMDIERANHGFGFQQVLNHFFYFLIFGTVINLRVLFGLPKAQ